MTAAQREGQQVSTYRQLLAITQEVLGNARLSVDATARSGGKNLALTLVIETLRKEILGICRWQNRLSIGSPACPLWRASSHQRQDLFHLRAPHRSDQPKPISPSNSVIKFSSPRVLMA